MFVLSRSANTACLLGLLSNLLFLFATKVNAADTSSSPFWPQPSSYSYTRATDPLFLSPGFKFTSTFDSKILGNAMNRYVRLFDVPSTAPSGTSVSECSISITGDASDSTKESFINGADESYLIKFSSQYCSIEATTVWGSINGMETFTQLFERDASTRTVFTNYETVEVADVNRFTHRGVMIDSARHYLPVDTITRMIDASKMSKFNVMHIHLVDAQSFPFDSPTSSKMVQGAFGPKAVYSTEDISFITDYAIDRGIRVVYEVDTPGHAASWGDGYPELLANCPDYTHNINNIALNPTLDETYTILQGILSDIRSSSGAAYMHIGGDEVVYNCWAEDPTITQFMADNDITSYDDLLGYFVQKADAMLGAMNTVPIHWEEVFLAGIEVAANTIFQVWQDQELVVTIAKAEHPVIASPAFPWYLDTWRADRPVPSTWQDCYAYDPAVNLTEADLEYLLGGEVVMFGEYIDENNIESIIFPRAMAVGERLWSSANTTDEDDALARIDAQRCRMAGRGFRAGPVQPSYCSTLYI